MIVYKGSGKTQQFAFFLPACFLLGFAVKMEAICSSEMLRIPELHDVTTQKTVLIHSHCCKNSESNNHNKPLSTSF
jgi:hypothetical protein